MQCFQKDPNLRVSAKKLLKHAWIAGCRRSDAPVSKKPANFNDQVVEAVKQWNKDTEAPKTSLRASTGSDHNTQPCNGQPASRFAAADPHRTSLNTPKSPFNFSKSKPNAESFRSPEAGDDDNWDNDFATASISPSALHLPHLKPQDHFGGKLSADRLKQFASIDEHTTRENWDDNFEGELMTIKGPRNDMDFEPQEQTLRPTPRRSSKSTESRTPSGHRRTRSKQVSTSNAVPPKASPKPALGYRFELPSRPEAMFREQSTEDFSEILFPDSEKLFSRKSSHARAGSSSLMPPPELIIRTPSGDMSSSVGDALRRRRIPSRPDEPPQPVRRTKSAIEIQKFAEGEDDEDFSDVFGSADTLIEKEESDRGSDAGGLMVLSKLSTTGSWLGDDEDEDDPFAQMDPEFNEMDYEANIARDRHARLAERVEELVQLLKLGDEISGEDGVSDVAEDLLNLLYENGEVKGLIVSAHGLLPILELITLPPDTISTSKSRQHMILQLLKVINQVCFTSFRLSRDSPVLIVSL